MCKYLCNNEHMRSCTCFLFIGKNNPPAQSGLRAYVHASVFLLLRSILYLPAHVNILVPCFFS